MLNSNSSYAVDILVNGNSCKQYHHGGRIFIEAKEESEYEIKIINQDWNRILAVASVDGLNVLTGNPATPEDDGYLVNHFNNIRIKGFRHNKDKVGAFKFTKKTESYATSISPSLEKNCGVIGVILYSEYVNPYRGITGSSYNTYSTPQPTPDWNYHGTGTPTGPTWTVTCGNGINAGTPGGSGGASSGVSSAGGCSAGGGSGGNSAGNSISVACAGGVGMSTISTMDLGQPRGFTTNISNQLSNVSSQPQNSVNFDLGTTWGQEKESKVVEVDFTIGNEIYSTDIYYASKEVLLQLGVPLVNEVKVAFPQSFTPKYATPPKNWKG